MNQLTVRPAHELVLENETLFNNANSPYVAWEKESQFAIQQLQRSEQLYKAALAKPASLQNAIINVAAVGISLNPANKHAYLVPRGGMVCLDVSYMGLMHLAVKSGSIEWGQAKLVYANDDYRNAGIDKAPIHTQQTFGEKGAIVGVYCTVKLKSGDFLTEEMDMGAINKVKATSKAQSGPWKQFEEEMIRKTVVKRASKYWPSSERINDAINVINEHEGLAPQQMETAPDLASYSQDQKQYFDQLITKEDAMGMHAFIASIGESVFSSLYGSFPKGEKGKYRNIVNALNSEGRSKAVEYADAITEAVTANDISALSELVDDLNDQELDLIKTYITGETSVIYSQMMREIS